MFSHIQEHHGTFKWSSPPLSFTNSFSLSICQAGKVLSPIFCMPGKFPGNRSFVTLKLLGDFRDLYLGFLKSKDSFPFLKGQMSVGSHRQHLLSRRILARSVALRLRTYLQSVNVGDTSTYDLSAYIYDLTGTAGEEITSTDAELYYNGATVTTAYTNAGSGWWKLTGTVTGANTSREYGVVVKSGKSVKVDDFTLAKNGTYSVYTTSAYSNAQVNSYDTFCEGTLSGSTCTTDASYSGNAAIYYQICLDDGSACSYSSGSRWQYYTG